MEGGGRLDAFRSEKGKNYSGGGKGQVGGDSEQLGGCCGEVKGGMSMEEILMVLGEVARDPRRVSHRWRRLM